jgi:putative flippase GtrA
MAEPAPTTRWIREIGGYGLASGAGLLLDMALLMLLVSVAQINYLIAATISFICGGALVYALSVTWVFKYRRVSNRALELSSFVALGAAGLLVNGAVMYVAVTALHVHFMLGKLLASGCTFGINFLLRRYFLFWPVAAAPGNARLPGT